MRSFISILIFCSSLLEFSSSRQSRGMWPPLIEKMRMLDDKFSEYIDTDLAKHDPSLFAINSNRTKTSPIGSLKKRSASAESFYNLPADEKSSKKFSTSDPVPKNYEQRFHKYDSSDDKTKPSFETMSRNFSLEPSKKVNQNKEIRKSEKFYWNSTRMDSNKQTENWKGSEKGNDYRNRRFFRTLTERSGINILRSDIPLQYTPISVESIGEISEENTETSANTMTYNTESMNSFSHASRSIISHFRELSMFNRSSLESSSNKTSNSSIEIHLPPSPNSKLSKTAVAAIVAAINGIIGFTGAAIFTCTKHNLSLSAERRPLIRYCQGY